MVNSQKNNVIKLGAFVLAGFALLIITLFLIGKNQYLFGSHFTLKAHFRNVSGLKTGNNVRYSGIEVGTVKNIDIINDTTVEVTLVINRKMKSVIRNNALTSLGSDGLMGNKVINIVPQKGGADFAKDGDILPSFKSQDMDDIISGLSNTNENIRQITEGLKVTVARINGSTGLWKLLSDSGLAKSFRKTARNLENATTNAEMMTIDLRDVIADVKAGKGPAGAILRDTAMSSSLKSSINQLEQVASQASALSADLENITQKLDQEINDGQGSVHLLLKDTALTGNISRTMLNVEKGTASFNENMEAMKHNFLFSGYFKKQEKEKAKQQKQQGKK